MKMLQLTAIVSAFALGACGKGNSDAQIQSMVDAMGRHGQEGDHRGDVGDHQEGEHGDDQGSRFFAERSRRGLEITPVELSLEKRTEKEIALIGYGSYLVNAVGDCSGCHTGSAGFLAGGVRFDIGPDLFVTARNLTPDRRSGLHLTEEQFIEAMRTGRDFDYDNARLIVMPWPYYRWMTLGDLSAIYAYLKVIEPVTNLVQQDMKPLVPPAPFPTCSAGGWSPTFCYDEGDVLRPLPPDTDRPQPNIERGLAIQPLEEPNLGRHGVRETFGRGSYLVNSIAACSGCHTNPDRDMETLKINTANYLGGGAIFLPPPPLQVALHEARAASSNLAGETHGFFHEEASTFPRFRDVIRSGTHVDEAPPRPLAWPMPWNVFRNMLGQDLFAVYSYMSRVPARTGAADKEIPDYARWCESDDECGDGQTCYYNPATGGINECVGKSCSTDSDCDVCQTCSGDVCVAPAEGNPCIADGL